MVDSRNSLIYVSAHGKIDLDAGDFSVFFSLKFKRTHTIEMSFILVHFENGGDNLIYTSIIIHYLILFHCVGSVELLLEKRENSHESIILPVLYVLIDLCVR